MISISLPAERLAFLLAVAVLNSERVNGEMSEGELVDAFREVCKGFEQTTESLAVRPIMPSMIWFARRFFNRFASDIVEGNAITG